MTNESKLAEAKSRVIVDRPLKGKNLLTGKNIFGAAKWYVLDDNGDWKRNKRAAEKILKELGFTLLSFEKALNAKTAGKKFKLEAQANTEVKAEETKSGIGDIFKAAVKTLDEEVSESDAKFEIGKTYFVMHFLTHQTDTITVEARTAQMLTGTTSEGTRKFRIFENVRGEFVKVGKDEEDGNDIYIYAKNEFTPANVEAGKKAAIETAAQLGIDTEPQAEPELPEGFIEVATGTDAFKKVAPYFTDGATFKVVSKGFNREDIFTFEGKGGIFLRVACTPDNSRVECVEVVNSNESGSKRTPLLVAIKPIIPEPEPEEKIEVNTGAETDGSEEDSDDNEVFNLLPEVDELNDTEVGWELYWILEEQKQKALGNYETQIGKARVTFRNHQIVEINEGGLIYKNRNGRKMHFLYGDLRSKKDFFDFILWAAAHDLQKEHQAAIKSYVETDGSEEDSEEEFIAVIPTDDSKDDHELVDPPAESPAEKSDYEISQDLSALFVKATINSRYMDVTLQDGKKIVTSFGCATIQPDWDADNGFIFTNRHETFAHYDTPAQVETVIEMIKATNERRGDKFTFPTVEELNAPPVNDIKSAAKTALEEAKANVTEKRKALHKAHADSKSTEQAEHELDLACFRLRGLENLIANSEEVPA